MRNLVFASLLTRLKQNRKLVGCFKDMDETKINGIWYGQRMCRFRVQELS
jgi:hypothetical protein